MKIIKSGKIIKVMEDDFCEEYSLDKEITFEKLTTYLLSKNLSVKIVIEEEPKVDSDNEQTLINIIKEIISKYNEEFEEYEKFLKEQETKWWKGAEKVSFFDGIKK